jgi:hypothetical protein
MIYDDVKKLSATHTPRQLAKKFSKEFKDNPRGLLHAHQMAAKVERVKTANARGPEIKAKVSEIMLANPNLNEHEAWVKAGRALGILP